MTYNFTDGDFKFSIKEAVAICDQVIRYGKYFF